MAVATTAKVVATTCAVRKRTEATCVDALASTTVRIRARHGCQGRADLGPFLAAQSGMAPTLPGAAFMRRWLPAGLLLVACASDSALDSASEKAFPGDPRGAGEGAAAIGDGGTPELELESLYEAP